MDMDIEIDIQLLTPANDDSTVSFLTFPIYLQVVLRGIAFVFCGEELLISRKFCMERVIIIEIGR